MCVCIFVCMKHHVRFTILCYCVCVFVFPCQCLNLSLFVGCFVGQALVHPFFEELRRPGVSLPNGNPLPDGLFVFSEPELAMLSQSSREILETGMFELPDFPPP